MTTNPYALANSVNGETARVNAQNYSQFGAPTRDALYASPKTGPTPKDREIECCLPGSLFNCSLLTDTSDCPIMMAQKCAEEFDQNCALYANTKAHSSMDDYRHFLRDTLRNRFCQLAPNSDCVKACTPFDPTAPNGSHLVCRTIGKEAMADASPNSTIDVGLNLPVNISPVYQGRCMFTCNVKKGAQIEAVDPVISECIRTGFCSDLLDQVCKDTDVANAPNVLLKTYCGISSALPVPSIQPAGNNTYGNDTYTYSSDAYGSNTVSTRAAKALTAIRQKLSSTSSNTGMSAYNDDQSDYSILWILIVLAIFYAIVYLLWKAKNAKTLKH